MVEAIIWLKKLLLEWIKEYPKYFLPFGLFSIICLFLPDAVLLSIGLLDLRNQFKPYFGAAVILSATFFLSAVIYKVATWIRDKYVYWITKRNIISRLKRITPEEANILIFYIEKQTYTQTLSPMNGVVTGLAGAGLIYPATRLTRHADLSVDYNIRTWTWDYLNRHPELIAIHKTSKPIHKAP